MSDVGFFQGIAEDFSKGHFRFIIQPIMAIILGVRLGVADAKEGKRPFLLRMFTTAGERWKIFRLSLTDAVLPLCIGLVMDGVFQYLTLHRFRLGQAIFVALLLIWIPFSISRALTNRAWTHSHGHAGHAA